MKRPGMINTVAVNLARAQLANSGAALAAEMSAFAPGVWPPHRYDPITEPTGVFVETTVNRSAPHFPGFEVVMPEWNDNGTAYDFANAEAAKITGLANYLFSKRDIEWLKNHFSFAPGQEVFVPFGARGDRSFESGKFPRDIWKAGRFDAEAWENGRTGIANAALEILVAIDQVNSENPVLANREWIITKFVFGPFVGGGGGGDTTFANVPQLMEDFPWADHPAYVRVSDSIMEGDASWIASGASFAWAKAFYEAMFTRLSSGAFARDYFDTCFTLWRTGSQTRRRDSYEE